MALFATKAFLQAGWKPEAYAGDFGIRWAAPGTAATPAAAHAGQMESLLPGDEAVLRDKSLLCDSGGGRGTAAGFLVFFAATPAAPPAAYLHTAGHSTAS